MMGGGGSGTFMNADSAANAQCKLEIAIEELRVKYEKIAEQKARDEAAAAIAEKNRGLSEDQIAAREDAKKETDWNMDDADMESIRQARIAALKSRVKERVQQREAGSGELREIVEDDFLKEVTSNPSVIVHFFHEEFMTCRVMDKHLRILAALTPHAKFLRINAIKAPFFTAKLRVKVLPTLVFFVDGIAIGRQTGFEGLVNSAAEDDFPTPRLLRRLRASGVLGAAERAAALEAADGEDEDDDDGADEDFNSETAAGWAFSNSKAAGAAGAAGPSMAAMHAARAARDASYYDIT